MVGNIFFWLTKRRQIQELAQRAEAMARDLNKLPTEPQQDTIAVLQSTCALLERLSNQMKEEPPIAPPELTAPPVQSQPETLVPPEPSALPSSLSTTARELMKLSDWVLLAKTDVSTIQPVVLEEIYRQLTKVLAKEGVTPLLATGLCDYERQMVVGTQVTDDPTKVDHVYSTVRPGYLFGEQLIRPQEVIVYAH